VEDMHDLVNLNKANTDLLKLVDNTIDKKLSLIKLMSTLVFKNDSGEGGGNDEGLSPEDLELLRTMFEDGKNKSDDGDQNYEIKD
jgi:hypothetical protein